jgi:transcription initiation factor TFIIE subunit alpha
MNCNDRQPLTLRSARETDIQEATFVQVSEIRKYMGMLLTHRLIKRYDVSIYHDGRISIVETSIPADCASHANKERVPIPEYLLKRNDTERTRLKEVIYYYLDYREFANVVKYRIAMMRKGIDEKIMQVSYQINVDS